MKQDIKEIADFMGVDTAVVLDESERMRKIQECCLKLKFYDGVACKNFLGGVCQIKGCPDNTDRHAKWAWPNCNSGKTHCLAWEPGLPLNYRAVTEKNTPAILKLALEIFGQDEVVGVGRWLRSSCASTEGQGIASIMFGAFVGDNLVGMAAAMENPACEHIVSLGHLAVHPAYRKLGIGRELVRLRAEWAQQWRPVPEVNRILELSCYDALVPYHQRHGFEIVRHHRPGISCIMQADASNVWQ